MEYIYDREGENKVPVAVLKEWILQGDFLYAWYCVCVYILKMDLQPFHIQMMKHRLSSNKTLIMAGRGTGKSYLLTTSYTITHVIRNRNIAIAVITRVARQSEDFVTELKKYFEEGGLLFEIFGDLKGDKWGALQFNLKRDINRLESTVTACSISSPSSLVSKHYDILIIDDIINDKSCQTKASRDNIESTLYNSVFPAINQLSSYKYYHVVGTHFHPDDIYVRIQNKGTYAVLKIPALRINKKGEYQSIWESAIKTKDLLELKNENPLAFEQQYMQKVRKASGGMFKTEWLQYFSKYEVKGGKVFIYLTDNEGNEIEKEVKLYAGCDLAISQKTTSDWFVETIVGVDKDKNVYILDYTRGHLTFNEQLDRIKRMNIKWKTERIGIESVQYQEALFQELQRTTYLPVIKLKTNKDKVSRLNVFSAFFETGKVFFYDHINNLTDMLDEFLGFPEAEHDDIPDATCMAWETSKKNEAVMSNLTRSMFPI